MKIGNGASRNALVFTSVNGASRNITLFLNGNNMSLNIFNFSFKKYTQIEYLCQRQYTYV